MADCIDLARQGQGAVEPNPMVGCVIVRDGKRLGRGFHQRVGDKHAEIEALDTCQEDVAGATVYVNLEPCCHHGRTPPCVDRLIAARVTRVVIAHGDPFPKVMGGGIEKMQKAGIHVDVGVCHEEARQLNAPYLKKIKSGRPWVIAKWAMTLDGKIATRTGDSKWISSEASRALVHQIRGRVDAIVIGSQTAISDNPLLTARPPGQRVATRIVIDSELKTPATCRLVKSAKEFPTIFVTSRDTASEQAVAFENAGCEVLSVEGQDHQRRLENLLDELGRREMTNILVEGGAGLLGGFFDIGEVDEIHVFVGNRLIGGAGARTPVSGYGVGLMSEALELFQRSSQIIGDDIYVSGRIRR